MYTHMCEYMYLYAYLQKQMYIYIWAILELGSSQASTGGLNFWKTMA